MPELSYREAVRDAIATAMREDDSVFIMGEDIAEMGGSMGVTQGLLDEFGAQRVRNTPISEMAIVGAGIHAGVDAEPCGRRREAFRVGGVADLEDPGRFRLRGGGTAGQFLQRHEPLSETHVVELARVGLEVRDHLRRQARHAIEDTAQV
jgi:hypothetical protein